MLQNLCLITNGEGVKTSFICHQKTFLVDNIFPYIFLSTLFAEADK